ncbi:hypothetical protein ACMWP8_28590, partial [Escherichia coli]|uniref:hypothetical protein n=1 Tax=Escherichia coli TaxID=562 RepID=UPI0039E01E04
IISSDGIDSFSPSELEGLARKMTGLRIQVFRLGVLTSDERADKHLAGLDIDQLVSRLHGRTFLTTTATETQSAYARIGELTGG